MTLSGAQISMALLAQQIHLCLSSLETAWRMTQRTLTSGLSTLIWLHRAVAGVNWPSFKHYRVIVWLGIWVLLILYTSTALKLCAAVQALCQRFTPVCI